jgi:hypothetical protein
MTFTSTNAPGYTDAGLRNLNRAYAIIVREHGFDMACLPDQISAEVDANLRDRLTNTHSRNLSVRKLLAVWAEVV